MSEHRIPIDELKAITARISGDCGLYVSYPETGERYTENEDMVFHAASTIKLPILAQLFADAENGLLDLNKKIIVKPENRVGGSGVLQSLSPDLELTVFDLAVLMIVMSDNTATNEVVDAVGMDRVRKFCADRGFSNTWMWGKMYFKGKLPKYGMPEGMPPNATSVHDLGGMLEQLATGRLISPEGSRKVVQVMAGQRLSRLKTLLPFVERVNPHAPELELPPEGKVVVASKSGTLTNTGIAHDAGIFYLPDGRYYIMAMCTKSDNITDTTLLINEAGLVMYNSMK